MVARPMVMIAATGVEDHSAFGVMCVVSIATGQCSRHSLPPPPSFSMLRVGEQPSATYFCLGCTHCPTPWSQPL